MSTPLQHFHPTTSSPAFRQPEEVFPDRSLQNSCQNCIVLNIRCCEKSERGCKYCRDCGLDCSFEPNNEVPVPSSENPGNATSIEVFGSEECHLAHSGLSGQTPCSSENLFDFSTLNQPVNDSSANSWNSKSNDPAGTSCFSENLFDFTTLDQNVDDGSASNLHQNMTETFSNAFRPSQRRTAILATSPRFFATNDQLPGFPTGNDAAPFQAPLAIASDYITNAAPGISLSTLWPPQLPHSLSGNQFKTLPDEPQIAQPSLSSQGYLTGSLAPKLDSPTPSTFIAPLESLCGQSFENQQIYVAINAYIHFILREYPILGPPVLDPGFQHPILLEPEIYNTMIIDVLSWMTTSEPSEPILDDKQNLRSKESLFNQIFHNRDYGTRQWIRSLENFDGRHDCPIATLEKEQVRSIYMHWQKNQFAFLFSSGEMESDMFETADQAHLAAIAGWAIFCRGRENAEGSKNSEGKNNSDEPHKVFFDFAQKELIRRSFVIDKTTPSTLQALVLLGAFRSLDKQPRCAWAMLSVAHLIARKFIAFAKEIFPEPQELSRVSGIYWLLSLYQTWSLLSMRLGRPSVAGMLTVSEGYADGTNKGSAGKPADAYSLNDRRIDIMRYGCGKSVNRMLLVANQLLRCFKKISELDPPNLSLASSLTSGPDAFEQELRDELLNSILTRCRTLANHAQHGTRETQKPANQRKGNNLTIAQVFKRNANAEAAIALGLVYLNRLMPFKKMVRSKAPSIPYPILGDVIKMLTLITREATLVIFFPEVFLNPACLGRPTDANPTLILKLFKWALPFLVILLQGAATTCQGAFDAGDRDHMLMRAELKSIFYNLLRYVVAGLSQPTTEQLWQMSCIQTQLGAWDKMPQNARNPS